MIDLHCHMLPGIDDGARDLDTALAAMARIALANGIQCTVCTPHVYPGRYDNDRETAQEAVARFQRALHEAGIGLELTTGADARLVPDLIAGLRAGRIPTLHGGRYFLLELPHHSAPPQFEKFVGDLLASGSVPLITHPERLNWIEVQYDCFLRLARAGAWIQVTAGSLTGRFRPRARYWAERMVDGGIVAVLATDAHGIERRPPLLGEGREAAVRWIGNEEAWRMVRERAESVLSGVASGHTLRPPGLVGQRKRNGLLVRALRRFVG
jgi:protein-tyrosine phosphatase